MIPPTRGPGEAIASQVDAPAVSLAARGGAGATNARTPVRIALALFTAALVYCELVIAALLVVLFAPRGSIEIASTQYDPIYGALWGHAAVLVGAAAGYFHLKRRRDCAAWLPRVLLPAGLIGLTFSIDRLVGIVFPPQLPRETIMIAHRSRGWAHQPNSRGWLSDVFMRMDSRGFRTHDDGREEPIEGRPRILFIGDSVTLGYAQAYVDAFPTRTAELLNRRRPKLDVVPLNAGVCGYDTRQEAHLLINEGFRHKPHLVILQFCLNDVTRQFDPAAGFDMERHPEFKAVTRPTSRSGLGRAFIELAAYLKWGDDLQAAGERIEHMMMGQLLDDPPPPHTEASWRNCLEQMDLIVDACRKKGVPLLLVCFPIRLQFESESVSTAPQDRLEEYARTRGVQYLDLLPMYRALTREEGRSSLSLFFDAAHPTAEGLARAAEAIVDALERAGLVDQLEAMRR